MEKRRYYIIFFAVILFVGFYLRTYQLGKYNLWLDEVLSLSSADYMKTMVSKMGIFDSAEDRYPSFLSNLFICYWQRLGRDEFTLRMSAVIFGMLTILAIYQIGKSLFGNKTGLLAAFILAISPVHIYYSREVRMYSMAALTVLLSVYYLIKALRCGKLKFWFGYLEFNLISIYLHYMNIFILLAEIIFFLIFFKRYRHLLKGWLSVHVVLFLLLIPWLINITSLMSLALTHGEKYYWVPQWIQHVSFKNILYTLRNFSAGYNAPGITHVPLTVIFLLLLVFGLIKKGETEQNILFLSCFLIPIFGMYLISKIKPLYTDRYVLPSALFYYLLVANGLSKLRNRYAVPILCSVVILNGPGIKNYYKDIFPDYKSCSGVIPKKDYRGAAKYIIDNFQSGDVVFHTCPSSIVPFEYYSGIIDKDRVEELLTKSIVLKFNKETGKITPCEFKGLGVKFIDSDISVENQRRVWLVFSSFIFDYAVDLTKDPDERRIRDYIDRLYVKKDSRQFKEIVVYLYEKRL